MAENNCVLPQCPICKEGYLLPFSFKEDVFEKWKCSSPDCEYVVKKPRDRDRY